MLMSHSEFRSLNSEHSILWRQVWGLAALLAAILLCFSAYGLYQPKILADFGFTQLAAVLGIVQGFLGAVLEPLVGSLSDRIMRRFGSRLPQIAVGVTLAGLIFVVLSFLIAGNLPPGLRWLVPILMTVWVMAMIVFRGPAIALLRQFAPDEKLPQANAVIILVLGLVGAAGPILTLMFKHLGETPTFIAGAIVLLLGAFGLYSQTPQHTVAPFDATRDRAASWQRLVLIFLVGLAAGFEANILLGIFPKLLQVPFPQASPEIVTAVILAISALSANPWGNLTVKLGVNRAMQIGLGSIVALMGLTLIIPNSPFYLALIFAFGLAFGLIFISMIPFALSSVPPVQAGLGTGLYFGGGGAGLALFAALMLQGEVSATVGFLCAAIAFVLARFCLERLNSKQ